MICKTCNNDHDGLFGSGIYCCRACANKRVFTNLTNIKRSFSMKTSDKAKLAQTNSRMPIEFRICKTCLHEFKVSRKHPTKTHCSNKCSTNDPEFKLAHSLNLKTQYANGKPILGGTTKWYDYKDIRVQGTYELRTCKILDSWVDIGKIKSWEYTKDRIPYIGFDDEEHTYLLDFKVYENDGSFYYIETKGYETDLDKLKWQSAMNLGI